MGKFGKSKKPSGAIRYSYSAADDFKQCPEKYWNKKTHTMKLQASAFGFGSAFESGCDVLLEGGSLIEAYARFKSEWTIRPENDWEHEKPIFDSEDMFYYGSDYDAKALKPIDIKLCDLWAKEIIGPKAQGALDITEACLEDMKNNKKIKPEIRKLTHRVLWMCCRRRGYYMLKAFMEEILPQVKTVHKMQEKTEVSNEEGDVVSGRIDYVVELKGHRGKFIMDLKSAGKPYEQHKLDTSDQLGIYAFSEGIKNIGYWIVIKKLKFDVQCDACGRVRENYRKKNCEDDSCKGKYTIYNPKCETQTLTKTVKQHTLDSVVNSYSEVGVAMKNGIRWKNPSSCFNYGTRCEYYDACWNGKNLDDIEHLKKKGGKKK